MRKQRHALRNSHMMALGTVMVLLSGLAVWLLMIATWR